MPNSSMHRRARLWPLERTGDNTVSQPFSQHAQCRLETPDPALAEMTWVLSKEDGALAQPLGIDSVPSTNGRWLDDCIPGADAGSLQLNDTLKSPEPQGDAWVRACALCLASN